MEPHELQVWTYSGGKTDPDQHILVKETIQLTLADSRGLVALTGGSEGEVVLEWTPADQRTQRWQYRERPRSVYGHGEYYIPDWSAWLDVPHSDATTQSLRVSGLAPSWIYVFQVRPWLRAGAGAASEQVDGPTATIGSDGIAIEEPGFCLERGRRFRFGPEVTFVVPPEMLLCTAQAGNTRGDLWSPCCTTRPPGPGHLLIPAQARLLTRDVLARHDQLVPARIQADRRDRQELDGASPATGL